MQAKHTFAPTAPLLPSISLYPPPFMCKRKIVVVVQPSTSSHICSSSSSSKHSAWPLLQHSKNMSLFSPSLHLRLGLSIPFTAFVYIEVCRRDTPRGLSVGTSFLPPSLSALPPVRILYTKLNQSPSPYSYSSALLLLHHSSFPDTE